MPGERRTSIYLYCKAASFVVHLVRNLPAVVKQHLCFEVIRDVCLSRIAAATLESPNFGARLVVWAALVECELNQVGAIAELRVCNLVLRRAMSLSVWSTSDVGEDYDVVPSVLKLSERPAILWFYHVDSLKSVVPVHDGHSGPDWQFPLEADKLFRNPRRICVVQPERLRGDSPI